MMSQKIGCLEACFTVSWIVVLTELGKELEKKKSWLHIHQKNLK